MEASGTGHTSRKSEGRATLGVRDPIISASLEAIAFDGFDIEQTRRFGNALLRARNEWADKNRHGRRYSDIDTARRNSLVRGGVK